MHEISTEKLRCFKSFIDSHDFFYIIGHKEPDGDCIASCLGVKAILEHFEKKYELLSAGPFKRVEIQKFNDLFTNEMTFLSEDERKNCGVILCDCSEISRIGDIDGDVKNLDMFVIDHHKTSDADIPNSIIDSDAPAASILVQLIYEYCVGEVTESVAKVLFFGAMTDTGFFRFITPKNADVFVTVSRLVKVGANPRTTYDEITSGKPFDTRKLLGKILDHAKQYLNEKLIVAYETLEDSKKYGKEGRDSDLLYSALLSVKNVEAVVFVRQDTAETCTVGLRSRDAIDVSAIAAKFGGGGHKNASGLTTEGKIDTLIPAIVKEFARVIG